MAPPSRSLPLAVLLVAAAPAASAQSSVCSEEQVRSDISDVEEALFEQNDELLNSMFRLQQRFFARLAEDSKTIPSAKRAQALVVSRSGRSEGAYGFDPELAGALTAYAEETGQHVWLNQNECPAQYTALVARGARNEVKPLCKRGTEIVSPLHPRYLERTFVESPDDRGGTYTSVCMIIDPAFARARSLEKYGTGEGVVSVTKICLITRIEKTGAEREEGVGNRSVQRVEYEIWHQTPDGGEWLGAYDYFQATCPPRESINR